MDESNGDLKNELTENFEHNLENGVNAVQSLANGVAC